MDLSDLLEPARIRCQCDVKSKKRTLQTLAELLGESLRAQQIAAHLSTDPPNKEPETDILTDMEVLDALISRERLGSTGLGHGVALPHSRLSNISEPIAAFVTLKTGVDFESADGQPVDLAVGLLVPEKCNDEHLKILAKLARRFSDEALRSTLRTFDSSESLYAHLVALPSVSD